MNEGNRKMRGIGLVIVALGLSFVMLAGAIGSFTVNAAVPKAVPQAATDNFIHIGMQDEPKSLNPTIPNDVWSSNFLGWMWDGTISRDPDDQSLQPWIATNWWEVGTDHKNFTVTYRFADWQYVYTDKAQTVLEKKSIKFHDNHEVDIYDLLFTFELAMNVPRWSSGFESLDKTPNGTIAPPECTDTAQKIHLIRGVSMDADPAKKLYTLHFKLNRTDASWELNYIAMSLYPYHLWKDKFYAGQFMNWNIETETLENQRKYVVGSGAFKYNIWKKGGQYAQLDTFTDYFPWNKMPRDSTGKAMTLKNFAPEWHWETKTSPITVDPMQEKWGDRPAHPYIDGIKYHIYYSVDTAILALQGGDVDVNWWTVDPGYIPPLTSNANIQLVTSEDTGFFYAAFNMRKQCFGYEDWSNPVVDKGLAFRKAFTMCTDKDSIVKRLLMNYGSVGTSVISPSNTEWHNQYVKTYPFDPAGAAAVLDAAGCTVGASGWRNIGPPIGESEFQLLHPTKDYDSVRYEAARMVVDQLRNIKVNIVSKPLQFGTVVENMNARSFDVYILGWRLGLEPDYMYDFFHSSQAGSGLNNHPGYHNPAYDLIVDQSRAELNRSKRVELIKQAQVKIANDCPYDVLYYRSNIEAYRKDRWAGWIKTSGGIMNGWSFQFMKKPSVYMTVNNQNPKVMTSGLDDTVNVQVTSAKDSSAVSGATVSISAMGPPGKAPGIFASGKLMDNATTDSNGIATFTYSTPGDVDATERNRNITFQTSASASGFELSKGLSTAVVYSPDVKYLVAKIDVAGSTLAVKEGEKGTLRVFIEDQTKNGAPGAAATLTVEPTTGLVLGKTNATTDGSGKIVVQFTAETKGNYTITVEPVKAAGIAEISSASASVEVKPPPPRPPSESTPWMIIIVVVVIVVVVIAAVAVVVMRKRAI
jgi:ABC-type transport system substrate-binding protein